MVQSLAFSIETVPAATTLVSPCPLKSEAPRPLKPTSASSRRTWASGATAATLIALAPSTIDTPANRKDMPDADPSKWVTPADLAPDKYFKSEALDPTDFVTTETPKAGVTIKRTSYGVPYVYGTTDDDVTWGAGWVAASDRSLLLNQARYNGLLAAIETEENSAPLAELRALAKELGIWLHVGSLAIRADASTVPPLGTSQPSRIGP
mgnify:CR=1 FL=1